MEVFLLFVAPFIIIFLAVAVLFWWGTIVREEQV